MKRTYVGVGVCLVLLSAASAHGQFRGPKGDSPDSKRQNVREQRDEILGDLYRAKPEMETTIRGAAGYATFKMRDVNLLLLASGSGYGLAVDQSGKEVFMRVASLGTGVGMGLKDLRVVFVFHDADFMKNFIDQGWQFGGSADASAKYQDTGVSADQSVKATPDFRSGAVATTSSTDVRAGAKTDASEEGGASLGGAMEVYQFTEKGVSLQATVAGTKYWKDKKLNE